MIPVGRGRRHHGARRAPAPIATGSAGGTSPPARSSGRSAFALSGHAGPLGLGRPRLPHGGHRGHDVRASPRSGRCRPAILSGNAAAAGIAWINSLGNLSGYVSPFVLGAIRDATRDAAHPNGNMFLALSVLAVSLFGAGALTLLLPQAPKSGPSR